MGKKKRSTKKSKEDGKKIIMMGLDNAGKTSIYLSLTEKANLLTYCSVKPTRGLDVKTIIRSDSKYSIWDFGGQKQFRAEYIPKLPEYLEGSSKIIYVIDIQDQKRYADALEYLEIIISEIKKLKTALKISVFLHKYDKEIEDLPEYAPERIEEKLVSKIEDIVGPDLSYGIFRTSIYTLFHKVMIG